MFTRLKNDAKLQGVTPSLQEAYLLSIINFMLYTISAAGHLSELEYRSICAPIHIYHPISILEYDEAINCLFPPPAYGVNNNGVFRSAEDFINEFTNTARLSPPVSKSAVCAVSGTLFDNLQMNTNNAKITDTPSLHH